MRYSLESRLRVVRLIEAGVAPAAAAVAVVRVARRRIGGGAGIGLEAGRRCVIGRPVPCRQPRRLPRQAELEILAARAVCGCWAGGRSAVCSAGRLRRCGRCFAATAAHGCRGDRSTRPIGMSVRILESCCTSISNDWADFTRRASACFGDRLTRSRTRRLAVRPSRHRRSLPLRLRPDPAHREPGRLQPVPAPRRRLVRRPRRHRSNASSPTTATAIAATPSTTPAPNSASSAATRDHADHTPTAKPKRSSTPCSANGPTASSTPPAATAPAPSQATCAGTTPTDPTAHSTATHPSAASHTSVAD